MKTAGRPRNPPTLPIGAPVRVVINSEGGLPLLARVVRNNPALVVVIVENDPIWAGCRLNPRQCRVVKERNVA